MQFLFLSISCIVLFYSSNAQPNDGRVPGPRALTENPTYFEVDLNFSQTAYWANLAFQKQFVNESILKFSVRSGIRVFYSELTVCQTTSQELMASKNGYRFNQLKTNDIFYICFLRDLFGPSSEITTLDLYLNFYPIYEMQSEETFSRSSSSDTFIIIKNIKGLVNVRCSRCRDFYYSDTLFVDGDDASASIKGLSVRTHFFRVLGDGRDIYLLVSGSGNYINLNNSFKERFKIDTASVFGFTFYVFGGAAIVALLTFCLLCYVRSKKRKYYLEEQISEDLAIYTVGNKKDLTRALLSSGIGTVVLALSAAIPDEMPVLVFFGCIASFMILVHCFSVTQEALIFDARSKQFQHRRTFCTCCLSIKDASLSDVAGWVFEDELDSDGDPHTRCIFKVNGLPPVTTFGGAKDFIESRNQVIEELKKRAGIQVTNTISIVSDPPPPYSNSIELREISKPETNSAVDNFLIGHGLERYVNNFRVHRFDWNTLLMFPSLPEQDQIILIPEPEARIILMNAIITRVKS